MLDGIALVFTDTAGLRDHTDDVIERIGIDRSQAAMHGVLQCDGQDACSNTGQRKIDKKDQNH